MLQPCQQLAFLGFLLKSVDMKVFLTTEKKEQKIILASQQLLKQNAPATGEVAQVIGLLVSSLPAVQYGPLFYRSIEIDKNMAVQQHKGNYSLFSHDVTRYPYLGVRHYGAPRQRNLM